MGCAASLMPNVSSFEAEYRNATLRRTATVPYETRLPPKTDGTHATVTLASKARAIQKQNFAARAFVQEIGHPGGLLESGFLKTDEIPAKVSLLSSKHSLQKHNLVARAFLQENASSEPGLWDANGTRGKPKLSSDERAVQKPQKQRVFSEELGYHGRPGLASRRGTASSRKAASYGSDEDYSVTRNRGSRPGPSGPGGGKSAMPCPAGNDETAPVWEQTLRHKYNTQDLAARSNEASSIWSSRSSDPGETRGLDQGEHGVFQHGASMGIKSAKVVPLNDSHLLNSAKSGNVAQLHSQEQDDATRHKTSTEMRSAKVVPLKDSDMLDKTRSSGPPRVCLPDDDATAPTLHRRTRSSATDAGTQLREHGVTVHWLMEFFNRAKTHFKGRNNFTTREVVDGIVAPACRRHNMPYACMPTVEMKRAQTYISHTWEATFEELVFCVYQTFSGQPDAAVWIDFLALQQGGTDKERRDLDPASGGEGAARGRWSSGMSSEPERLDVVAELGGALLVLDRNAAALTDAWCLVESMAAASLRGLRIVPSLLNKESAKALSIRIGQLDINSAAAWPQSRTAAIQKFVQVRCGTGVSFNQVLRRQILECLPGIVLQCQQIHGRMSPEAAQAAELLAAVLKEYGELELATGLAATTLGILESLHGLNDPRVASTANNLANLWRLQGNLDAAQSLYSRAVASIESAESDSEALVHALLNLADTQKARGKLSEAAASYRKALACTGAGGTLRLLPAVLGLAHCLKATGDAPDAMQVLMEALNSLAQHPDKVPSSGNYEFQVLKSLGDVCKGAFDYARAEHYYERAVALKQECVASSPAPADELELATAMNGLASVLRLSGKHQRAEELYRQALAIREKHLPGDHPNIVSSTLHVAAVMKEHEAFESAAQMYRRALQVLEKTRGPMHLDVSSVLCNLATCLQETGNLKEAESLASRALRIRSAALGSEHAESVKALHVLESITSTQKSSQLL